MKYIVTFSEPMVYLPNHPKQRSVNFLPVWADSEVHALQHAIRVTEGAGVAEEVRECPDA